VFLPNSQLGLTPIAEEYFRKQQKLGDKTWEEAGFWFENNQFQLSKKFILLKDRVRFEYNEYEIAPYVMGAPVVEIPYSAIMDYLKPEITALVLNGL
ncbi:MAG: RsiV family protein, partial [Bacteroidia bacterium]